MDRALFALVFLATIGSGIVGGIFYAFSSFVMRGLERIAPEQSVAAMNAINITVITPSFMIVFVGTALLCLGLAAGSYFWWGQGSGKLVLAAALLYLVGTFGVTMLVNQPLNLRLAAMTPTQAIAFWPQYLDTWVRWNHVRTAASLLSATLFIVALVMKK